MTSHATGAGKVTGWIGIFLSPLVWFAHQQLSSIVDFADCTAVSTGRHLAISTVALTLVLYSAGQAWAAWREGLRQAPDDHALQVFAPCLSLLLSGLLAMAILLQCLAGLLLPPCFR